MNKQSENLDLPDITAYNRREKPPLSRRPALILALSMIAGILLHSLCRNTFSILPEERNTLLLIHLSFAFIGLGCVLYNFFFQRFKNFLLLCGCVMLAFVYADFRAQPESDNIQKLYPQGQKFVILEGIITESTTQPAKAHDSDFDQQDSKIILHPEEHRLPGVFKPQKKTTQTFLLDLRRDITHGIAVSGQIKVYFEGIESLLAGDSIRFTGSIQPLPLQRNPGEPDLTAFYHQRGIDSLAFVKASNLHKHTDIPWTSQVSPRRFAEKLRTWVMERIGQNLSARQAALLNCIALGDRSALTPELKNDFIKAGSMHILVVSGLHVMILGVALLFLCRMIGLKRRFRGLVIGIGAFIFLLITGIQIATLRAASIVILYSFAEWRGRKADFLNLLGASALFILIWEPADFLSLGFQLSYLSVLGLALFMPLFQFPARLDPLRAQQLPTSLRLFSYGHESIMASIIATASTFPIVLRHWNLLAPISILVNLLVLVPLALILGSLLFLPGAYFDFFAQILSWWLGGLLGFLDLSIQWAAAFQNGHFYLRSPHLLWISAYYASLLVLIIVIKRFPTQRSYAIAGFLVILALLPWSLQKPGAETTLNFLDVQHGACTILETQAKHVCVIDCGSQRRPNVASWSVAPFLFERGYDHIDLLILSHPDADHINGVAQLLEYFSLGELWVDKNFESSEQGKEVLAWLQSKVQKIRFIERGSRLRFDEVALDVLWPDFDFVSHAQSDTTASNEASLVLHLDLGYASVLLPSDVEDTGLVGIGSNLPQSDILVSPHHGSTFLNIERLLQKTQPQSVIASTHADFMPAEVEERYTAFAPVIKTQDAGTITIRPLKNGKTSNGRGFMLEKFIK